MLQVLPFQTAQRRQPTRENKRLAALLLAISVLSFGADCFTAIPIAGGVLYVPLVFVALLYRDRRFVDFAVVVAMSLTLIGMFLPHLPSDLAAAFANRALSMLVIAASGLVARHQLRLMEQLDLEAARAAEVRATKSRFFQRVTRDVRDSLRTILARQETLRARQEPLLRLPLEEIGAAGQRAEAAIDNMLDLLGVEARPLVLEPVDVDQVVQTALQPFGTQAVAHELRLEVDGEKGLLAQGDRWALSRALIAILDNAFRFTPPEGTVVVSTRRAGAEVLIHVDDDGVGFPSGMALDIDRLGTHITEQWETGTGLGLPLVSILVARMGGSVEIDTQRELGASVTIRLPVCG